MLAQNSRARAVACGVRHINVLKLLEGIAVASGDASGSASGGEGEGGDGESGFRWLLSG